MGKQRKCRFPFNQTEHVLALRGKLRQIRVKPVQDWRRHKRIFAPENDL
jgi:hypothetical protein